MKKYMVSVLAAGVLWGTIGVFRRSLNAFGFSTSGIVFIRSFFALVCFALTVLVTDRNAFNIRVKDLWCFIGTGLVSFLLFTLCYFKAMQMMSLSSAAILLYSAPCFVILISIPCFNEKISSIKVVALVLAFTGCCFVSGLGLGGNNLSLLGVFFGLGSGICYALYSIFSRFALNKCYSSLTINFWTCLFASIGSFLIGGYKGFSGIFISPNAFLLSLATGIVTCYLPYMLYTYGLIGLDNGKASIIASVEPIVATLCGIAFYGEALTVHSAIGIAFVLGAIVLLNVKADA